MKATTKSDDSPETVTFIVDHHSLTVAVPAWASLRTVLDQAGMGPPAGCDAGHCGSCTVLVDRVPVPSCLAPASDLAGAEVQTVRTAADPRLAAAFAEHGAVQCGYCTPGMLVTLADLLRRHEGQALAAGQVRAALDGQLCRCTGYAAIVTATLAAHARPGEPP